MIWYQAAFDERAEHPKQWVVLRFGTHGFSGDVLAPHVHSRWPTQHEAEGHAKKALGGHAR